MQKKQIQANQLTKKLIFCELIFLEIQNSFWCSSLAINRPQNVFFKKIEKLDLKPSIISKDL